MDQHYQAQGTHTMQSLSEVYFLSDHHPPRKEVRGKESRGHRVLASVNPPTLLRLVTLLIKLGLMCGLCKALMKRHKQYHRQYQGWTPRPALWGGGGVPRPAL